jgi:hypothetical protein
MDGTINVILVASSVAVAFIGLFFVLKIWLVWKRVDRTVLKARVFLDEEFLVRNWIYIFIVGAFIVLRRILQLLVLLGIPIQTPEETILSDVTGLAVVTLLVLLSYHWYKLVYSAIERSHTDKYHKQE